MARGMKGLEIERKYLLKPCSPKRFLHSVGSGVSQVFYAAVLSSRAGRRGMSDIAGGISKFFKTIKSGEGMVREESEYLVTKEEFDKHLEDHVGKIIEKERFVFAHKGLTYELDRFFGPLKGLCYLEIEFDDEEAAEAVSPAKTILSSADSRSNIR